MSRRGKIDEKVVEIDVGGKTFQTFQSTLTKVKGSFLELFISEKI